MGTLLVFASSCKKNKKDDNNPTAKVSELTTSNITVITATTAVCGGNITSDGGASVTERGVCWSTSQTPTVSNYKKSMAGGAGSFSGTITGLSGNTIYYVRSYAINSAGTAYGNEVSLTTGLTETDIDGNIYHIVTIGTQVWLLENLNTTKYNDGTLIPLVTDNSGWNNLTTGAYSDYNNTPSNSSTYGRLYNWYAVNNAHKICPLGWHVPSDAEWTTLETYLGISSAGGKLKEAGTIHWTSPNVGATNETGFTALPGGSRYPNGSFNNIGNYANWWTATDSDISNAFHRNTYYNLSTVSYTEIG
ncbi:MAG: fibrobacter succinogenes major paralogous domain-containing protein [Bacteroidales bacterium]